MGICDSLNPQQREAALATEGPVLVLAGAGTGKTAMMTHRIAHLVGEMGVPPEAVLGLTFTNRAAAEMRRRAGALVGDPRIAARLPICTFHSFCRSVLKKYPGHIGRTSAFGISDAEDQKKRRKEALKDAGCAVKEADFAKAASALKAALIRPGGDGEGDVLETALGGGCPGAAEAYAMYEEGLRRDDMLDFDGLIMETAILLRDFPDVLAAEQGLRRYIMVDEFQDTDRAQFSIVRALAAGHGNLCVVGDDDQAIYSFRGADAGIILGFTGMYPDAHVVALEQNYRCTGAVLDVANCIIRGNARRHPKKLWTLKKGGAPVVYAEAEGPSEEAACIAGDILARRRGLSGWGDSAVLYRRNSQSRAIEEAFVRAGVPYELYGGVGFYSRREVKDLLAYLSLAAGGRDSMQAKRAIGTPRRGIGAKAVGDASRLALEKGITFLDACRETGRKNARMAEFCDFADTLMEKAASMPPSAVLSFIIDGTGYREWVMSRAEDTDEADARLENIAELENKIALMEEDGKPLGEMLDEIALLADSDMDAAPEDRVKLMTLHKSKGLEFDNVYIAGMDEGMFPDSRCLPGMDGEERRLAYVGVTRARKRLMLLHCGARPVYGEWAACPPSRFIREIDPLLLDMRSAADLPSAGKEKRAPRMCGRPV